MTNKELELIGKLTEVAMTVAELKAENKILKDINENLMQALRIHDVSGSCETISKKETVDQLDDEDSDIHKIGREIAEMSDEEFDTNSELIDEMLKGSKSNGR